MGRHGCLAALTVLAIASLAWLAQSAFGATESVTFQVDPGHSGYVYGAGVVPPLQQAWSVDLNWGNQYVGIDAGEAFAFSQSTDGSYENRVNALGLATGQILWSRSVGQRAYAAYLTVDNGRVYTAVSGVYPPDSASAAIIVSAYDEATGQQEWSDALTEQGDPTPPVARDGVLYLEGDGEGGTVYAIRESDGQRLWTSDRLLVGNPVTLTDQLAVTSSACGLAYGLDLADGHIVWTHDEGCDGGGTFMASFDGQYVWGDQGEPDATGRVFDPASGNVVKRFSWYAPAFGYGEAVQATTKSPGDLELRAFDPNTMQTRWSFDENDGSAQTDLYTPPLGTTPLLADGHVFAAGSQGKAWALDPTTGATVWQADTGQPAPFYGYDHLPGLSAGGGYLIIDGGDGLTAFKGSGYPTGPPPSVGQTAAGGSSSTSSANGTPGGANGTGTRARPVISGLRVIHRRLVIAAKQRSRRATTFDYHLSMNARVMIDIQRRIVGVMKDGRCRNAASAHRARRRCTRYHSVTVLRRSQGAGTNRVRFDGRIHGRTVAPGRYRGVVTATAANGQTSIPRSARFVVAAP